MSSDLSEVLPTLCRVYKGTVQRLLTDANELCSRASYVLTAYHVKSLIVWVGKLSSKSDSIIAESLASDIVNDDCLHSFTIMRINEQLDSENGSVLEGRKAKCIFLSALSVNIQEYMDLQYSRERVISNSPTNLFIYKRNYNNSSSSSSSSSSSNNSNKALSSLHDEGLLHLVSSSNPLKDGSVPFLTFYNGNNDVHDKNIILVLIVGDQFDVWLGDAVETNEILNIKSYLTASAMKKVEADRRGIEALLFTRNIRFQRQYYETTLFRSHFSSASSLALMGHTFNKSVSTITKTNIAATECHDCIGMTIFRMMGLDTGSTEASSYFRNDNFFHTPSRNEVADSLICNSNTFFETDNIETKLSFNSFEIFKGNDNSNTCDDTLNGKLEKALTTSEINYLNPPREGKHLAVLDLDHTLMDFSCRFEYDVEKLKRPYMDMFLSEIYKHYDIAVWSQTNYAWLHLKLKGLGLLTNGHYKICFALDKSSMFTYKNNYVKPLKLIWLKVPTWGQSNTIHVDDLARNFELNKRSGVLVTPFYLKNDRSNQSRNQETTSNTAETIYNAPESDVELMLLSNYMVHIATTSNDFTHLDHTCWREKIAPIKS